MMATPAAPARRATRIDIRRLRVRDRVRHISGWTGTIVAVRTRTLSDRIAVRYLVRLDALDRDGRRHAWVSADPRWLFRL